MTRQKGIVGNKVKSLVTLGSFGLGGVAATVVGFSLMLTSNRRADAAGKKRIVYGGDGRKSSDKCLRCVF